MKKKSSMKKAAESMKMDTAAVKDSVMGNGCVCGAGASECAGWGLFILRVITGGLFLLHGLGKFFASAFTIGGGWSGTVGFFSGLFGTAMGPFLAGLVASVEVLAGIALILGIWSRWASYLLIIVLVVAIAWAKKFAFPLIEPDMLYIGSLIAIAWNGAGKWSLHSSCGCCGDNCNC